MEKHRVLAQWCASFIDWPGGEADPSQMSFAMATVQLAWQFAMDQPEWVVGMVVALGQEEAHIDAMQDLYVSMGKTEEEFNDAMKAEFRTFASMFPLRAETESVAG